MTQIAIADLVRCYGWCLKDMNIDRMISAINVVYPTGNLLLDVIFSELTIYKNFLLNHSDKHVPDYMEQEDVLFSGDTLFRTSVGRSDFPGGSASALVRSVKEKLLILPEETHVYPGHMEETTIGYEKLHNPFI